MSDVFGAVLVEPTEYSSGVRAGFIVFPHSVSVEKGWGEPYYNPDGTAIQPGTKDGPNPNRLIGYLDYKGWKMRRSRYWQVAGAIDWWGDWQSQKQDKRVVLSWNGPSGRHFNPLGKFKYDDDPKNLEIYQEGKLLAIAPRPVLGAALCKWDKPNDDGKTTTPETLLVVICKNGYYDEAYVKVAGRPMPYDQLTPEKQVGMARFATPDNPTGWEFIGSFKAPEGATDPEVPWFFNTKGTAARAMRRISKTFENERGETKIQNAYIELLFGFQPQRRAGNFTYLDSDKKFTYQETCKKEHPTYQDIGYDQWGLQHQWQEDSLKAAITTYGQVKVAVEWSPTEEAWVYAWFDVQASRRMEQYWTTGIDDVGAPHSNHGSHDGNRWPTGVHAPGDHTEGAWFGVAETCKLLMGKKADAPALSFYMGFGRSGTKSLLEKGIEDPATDPWFYFWDSVDVFLHHLDLRTYLLSGYLYYDSVVLPQEGPNVDMFQCHHEIVEWAATYPTQPWDTKDFFSRYTSPIVTDGAAQFFYWTRAEMEESWPEEFDASWDVTDYQAERGTANDTGSIFQPVLTSYFHNNLLDTAENRWLFRYPLDDYFIHPTNCYRKGQFSSAEDDTYLVTYEYIDAGNGELQVAVRLYPEGNLAEVCNLTEAVGAGVASNLNFFAGGGTV